MKRRFFSLLLMASAAIFMSQTVSGQEIEYHDAAAFPLYGKASENTLSRYERLPGNLESVSREPVWILGRNSTGLYIRFRSNSTAIYARWTSRRGTEMNHMAATGIRGLDLYAMYDGE